MITAPQTNFITLLEDVIVTFNKIEQEILQFDTALEQQVDRVRWDCYKALDELEGDNKVREPKEGLDYVKDRLYSGNGWE